ncbi:hypothetical protein MHA_2649 [Mannheimia haemolytica PHL213]|nr:hypothetical protein MHA_2649 [Mannheimia haemolytica PHL213]
MTQLSTSVYQRADGFINVANAHLKNIAPNQVSNAMLFGCARFNAYVAARRRNINSSWPIPEKKLFNILWSNTKKCSLQI